MNVSRQGLTRIGAIVALLGLPLVCAELYFRLVAPGQSAGVYLETDRAYKVTLLEADRSLHTLLPYDPGAAGSAAEAIAASPLPMPGRKLAFFIVDSPDAPAFSKTVPATLWCFVVEKGIDHFRDRAVSLPATITQINPRTVRVTTEELEHAWGADRIAFQQYAQALADGSSSRKNLDVLIGLELQDVGGARRMYSVRVGPPR